jgi:hypothetical protein
LYHLTSPNYDDHSTDTDEIEMGRYTLLQDVEVILWCCLYVSRFLRVVIAAHP